MMGTAGALAEYYAEMGKEAEARACLAEMRRFEKIAVQRMAAGSWNRVGFESFATTLEADAEEAFGNHGAGVLR